MDVRFLSGKGYHIDARLPQNNGSGAEGVGPGRTDPLLFPDLSLTVIKLLGEGEYTAELPGDKAPGQGGLLPISI